MSSITQLMFDTDFNASEFDRVPTIRQFLKKLPKNTKVLDQSFLIDKVWLPGKFDNVTLETYAFRIILNPKHALYDHFISFFADNNSNRYKGAIGITITDRDKAGFSLNKRDNPNGDWQTLGANGYRFSAN